MINEHDIKDWIHSEVVPLYNVPRDSVITVNGYEDTFLFFHNIDGMYSYNEVISGEHRGKVAHIAAWTPVKIWTKPDA